jgi:hypothetical protein
MTTSFLVQVGSINGGSTPITVDIGAGVRGNPEAAVAVTLSTDYAMTDPPGYPSRPNFTGTATPQFPQTIASGLTITLLQPEAAALVAAGAGENAEPLGTP